MTNQELMLESLKLGLALTSPSSHNRHEEVVMIGKMLYSEIVAVDVAPQADTQEHKPRGRPRKPRAE
jgi:hypothetical protein